MCVPRTISPLCMERWVAMLAPAFLGEIERKEVIPTTLEHKDVTKFKALYLEPYGVELSEASAEEQLRIVVEPMRVVSGFDDPEYPSQLQVTSDSDVTKNSASQLSLF